MPAADGPEEPLPRIEVTAPYPASRNVSPPPPSLAHLFLFVACCAVYLAASRRFIAAEATVVGLTVLGIYGLGAATAWSALAILIARLVRGARWPVEPGFYLAAVLGLRIALDVLLAQSQRPLFQPREAVLNAITCMVFVWPLMGRWPLRWKGIVVGLLMLHGLLAIAIWFNLEFAGLILLYGRPYAIILLIGVGACLDRWRRAPFSWLHGLGIILWVWYAAMSMIFGSS